MGSKSQRISCSFLNLLLSFFNFILFLVSAASVAPIIFLKMPPTSLGCGFLVISSISILSSFLGFCTQLSQFCYITHLSLLLASAAGQLLGILALFTKEKSSLSALKSGRDPREAKLLVRLECGVLMAMFVMQIGVLILCCAVVHRDYQGLEPEKRRPNISRVSMENAEVKNMEMGEKIKYGKLIKSDIEGY